MTAGLKLDEAVLAAWIKGITPGDVGHQQLVDAAEQRLPPRAAPGRRLGLRPPLPRRARAPARGHAPRHVHRRGQGQEGRRRPRAPGPRHARGQGPQVRGRDHVSGCSACRALTAPENVASTPVAGPPHPVFGARYLMRRPCTGARASPSFLSRGSLQRQRPGTRDPAQRVLTAVGLPSEISIGGA
jgi:hypothetical protein